MAVLAGIDFFTAEVLHLARATYYVLFFLHLETRRVTLAGISQDPTKKWMVQMARQAVDDVDGALLPSALFCMIATASSALPSATRFVRPVFNLSAGLLAVRI